MPELLVAPTIDSEPGMGWVEPADLAACAPTITGSDLELACDFVAEVLFALSGAQFGSVTDTVRPVRVAPGCGCGGAYLDGYSRDDIGSWWSWPRWGCGCGGNHALDLLAPVIAIDEVLVDGVALVKADVRLYDGRWLVRTEGSFPCCQDLQLPSSEPGTFMVKYTHGPGVPAGGRTAARVFGCEVVKALAGVDCALTGRIQSVNRDGVSAVVFDDQGFIAQGRTGLHLPDLWLASLGNVGPQSRSSGFGFRGPSGLVRDGS